jgi:hypothetical protein
MEAIMEKEMHTTAKIIISSGTVDANLLYETLSDKMDRARISGREMVKILLDQILFPCDKSIH